MSDPMHDLMRVIPFLSADPATVAEREHGARIERLQQQLASVMSGREQQAQIVPLQRRAG